MKRNFILLFLIIICTNAYSQNEIADCIRNKFLQKDSLEKIGKSFDVDEVQRRCVAGKQIPDFNLVSLNGDTIKLKNLKGKIIVINFWFIDCHPCIAEMPGLNKLVAEYKNSDIVFLAVAREKAINVTNRFLSKYKLDFTIITDADSFINRALGTGYPTTYFIDRNGRISELFSGGRTDEIGQAK